MKEDFDKNIAILKHSIEKLHEINNDKQIGKTFIQKLFYIFNNNKIINIPYELYHYGPYSFFLNSILNISETVNIINISWRDNKGYFIKPSNENHELKTKLENFEKEKINTIINKVKDLNAKQLSILCTANYILSKFDIEEKEIISILNSVKKDINISEIKKIYDNFYSNLFNA